MKSRRDDAVCFLCDYWWLFLILLAILLAISFTHSLWEPLIFPPSTDINPPTLQARPQSTNQPINTVTAPTQLGTGDVQVTLHWDGPNDLDLHVIDPAGEEIFYIQTTSASHGQLDVDANRGCSTRMDKPVENIFWPTNQAPVGIYQIAVNYYENCEPSSLLTLFTVDVLIDGKSQTFQGQVDTVKQTVQIYTFTR